MQQIDFSQFHNLVNHKFYPYLFNTSRFEVHWGGAGSGKSQFITQKIGYRILTERNHRVIVCRKFAASNKKSTFQLFQDVFESMGISHLAKIFRSHSDMRIELEDFNSTISFIGMDDPEKIKSIAGTTMIWYEEVTEGEEDEIDQLNLRLRGKTSFVKQFFMSFNPVSKEHWIRKKYFEEENDDVVTVHSTYLDNRFLDQDYIDNLENNFKKSPFMYQVYVLGKWGNISSGGEFYAGFDIIKNVKRGVKYDPEYPIILSYDFNAFPYSACLICQLIGRTLYIINELALKHPANRPADVTKKFSYLYPSNKVIKTLVTGDASGKNSSSLVEDGVNNYTQIFKVLEEKEYLYEDKVPSRNANVIKRGEFINGIFKGEIKSEDEPINIVIDESCQNLIDDLMNIKSNADSTKLKQKVKDKKTGITYEKYGHFSDCLDSAVTTFLDKDFTKFFNERGGKSFGYSFKSNYDKRIY